MVVSYYRWISAVKAPTLTRKTMDTVSWLTVPVVWHCKSPNPRSHVDARDDFLKQ